MFTRIKSYSRLKKNKEKINCNNEDEEIKKISKDINREYKRAIYLDFSSPKKTCSFVRNQSSLSSTKFKTTNQSKIFSPEKQENTLSFKLKDKIAKETLILELRQELKYHIKFNAIYHILLKKIINLKETVKENKDKLQQNTDSLKQNFVDQFNIIDHYEKTIALLKDEKNEINRTNKEIIKMRHITKEKLNKDFNDIQVKNSEQGEKIDALQNKINDLEYKKNHVREELYTQIEKDEKKYEEHLKMYKSLAKKYDYFFEEYNSFVKSGNEMTKIDVKLFDETNAKNTLIEENLEVDLNEKLLKKSFLLDNISNLKQKIKIMENKQKEEKLKEEKKAAVYKLIGFNKSRINKNKKSKNRMNRDTFKKSLSFNHIFLKNN